MTFSSNPLRITVALLRQRRWLFILAALCWMAIHTLPVLTGLLTRGLFDLLSGAANAADWGAWTYLALALSVDVGRIFFFAGGIYLWTSYWLEVTLHLRNSLLGYLLEASGSRRLPDSPSEAVTRFRDDVNDVGEYVENWVDFWGFATYAIVALAVMLSIQPALTLVACAPLAVTVLATNRLRPLIRNARRRSRQATSRVTDFLGETFGSAQAVKVAGKEASVLRHFEGLNASRKDAALADTLLTELFRSVTDNMVNVATAIVLLLGANALKLGSFTVGEFALFVTFLPRLTYVMSFFGLMLVQHKRTGVAYERLGRLLVDAPVEAIITPRELGLERVPTQFTQVSVPRERFLSLQVEGLSYHHPDSAAGLSDVSFEVKRGELVVITGRIGSGKSTLLKVLLGLLPKDGGSVRWNGEEVSDAASFFVPPRTAYTSQVPRLFSDSFKENVLLGSSAADSEVAAALELAVLGPDLAALHHGVETEVGARGVRLSGGQVQRTAAARMFLRRAELLVFDDISSALDVHTERRLWDGLFASGDVTCLVVSHRRAALERADRVLVMDAGRLLTVSSAAEVADLVPDVR